MTLISLAVEALESVATNIVLAVLTLLLGLVLGKLIGKITHLVLHEFDIDQLVAEFTGIELPLEQMISSVFTYAIYLVFFIFALEIVEISSEVFTIVATVLGVIIVLYMFLGLKDFVPNAVAGLLLYRKKQIQKGIKITAEGFTGIVRSHTLTETRIVTNQGDTVTIPNSLLMRHPYLIHKGKT